MKIRARDHAQLHGVMRSRGLPESLLRAEGEIIHRDFQACTHARLRPVPPPRQLKTLSDSMNHPRGDWVMVIGSRQDPDLLQLLGMEFFARCIRHGLDDPRRYPRPYWHVVHNGRHDSLRDSKPEMLEQRVGHVGALVLSGATSDCPPEKLEKFRDHLLAYQGVPRLVLVSGGDPLQFAVDRLLRNPDCVAFINRSSDRARQEH